MNFSNTLCLLTTAGLWTMLSFLNTPHTLVLAKPSPAFNCYFNPKTKIYTTKVDFPNGKSKDIILWTSKSFFSPKDNCYSATQKFQDLWGKGKLRVLKYSASKRNGIVMICGLRFDTETCDEQNKIFVLRRNANPKVEISNLLNALEGQGSPIYQSSSGEVIINFQEFIEILETR